MIEFFQIHVPMWVWGISQAVGFVGMVIIFIALQQKSKTRQLYLQSLALVFAVIANSLILNMILVANLSVNVIKNFTYAVLDSRKDKIKNWTKHFFFALFTVLSFTVTFLVWLFFRDTWTWLNLIILVSVVVMNYAKVYKSVHWVKWGMFANGWLLLINAFMFANIMGGISSLIIIVSVIVFYIKRKEKEIRS
ncbi:MAG: YgjV family protein [Firmicutes bacterium]|nr:YgjV family protein [Bacillota bacterium]